MSSLCASWIDLPVPPRRAPGIVRDLVERGIRVNVLNMGIADNTPMGKMMVTVMLAFAEYEQRHDRGTYPVRQGCAARDGPGIHRGPPRIEA